MADRLTVNPIDLQLSSDHMDFHHGELTAVHDAADGEIEAAHAGWVGVSATALQARFAQWQATTAELTADIAAHGAAFRDAAASYASTDTISAADIDGQV